MKIFTNEVKDEGARIQKRNKLDKNYNTFESPTPRTQCNLTTVIEPIMFLYQVAAHLSDAVVVNLLEYRTCKVELELSDANCTEPISSDVEELIQPTTAYVIMNRSLINALVPACLIVFIGPWSDVNGRKPFLIIGLLGTMLTYISWGTLSLLPSLEPRLFLLALIPHALCGGCNAVYLLCFCYVSDVCEEFTRRFRLSLLTLSTFASSLIGTACAPLLIAAQDTLNPYPLVFFLSAFLLLLVTIYTYYIIQESVEVEEDRERRLFLSQHVRDLCTICFKQREGHARTMSWLIVLTLTLTVFFNEGETAIMYLSTRAAFSWQLSDYALFNSFSNVVHALGTLSGVWMLSTWLNLTNMTAATWLVLTRVARCTIMAVSDSGLGFYLGCLASTFVGAHAPLSRTELTKLVSQNDLGKIFALTAFLETISPIAAAPLYTQVYEATFLYNPVAVYWVSVVLAVISVVMLSVVVVLQRVVKGACYPVDSGKETDKLIAPNCQEILD